MATTKAAATDNYAWEKELAPKVTRGSLMLPIVIYVLWTGLLAYIAYDRWFGALQ
jgi:hypothetical protein